MRENSVSSSILKKAASCVACRCSRTRRAPRVFPATHLFPSSTKPPKSQHHWSSSTVGKFSTFPCCVVDFIFLSHLRSVVEGNKTRSENFRFFFSPQFRWKFCFVLFSPCRPPEPGDCFVVAVLFFRLFLLLFCCVSFFTSSLRHNKKKCELKKSSSRFFPPVVKRSDTRAVVVSPRTVIALYSVLQLLFQ